MKYLKLTCSLLPILLLASCASLFESKRFGYTQANYDKDLKSCYMLLLDKETSKEVLPDSLYMGKLEVKTRANNCGYEVVETEIRQEACNLGANIALLELKTDYEYCTYTVNFYKKTPGNFDLDMLLVIEKEFSAMRKAPKKTRGGLTSGIFIGMFISVIILLGLSAVAR